MKKTEIARYLNRILPENLNEAMELLDTQPGKTKSIIRHYSAISNEKEYPPPELIRSAYSIATNEILPDDFFIGIGNGSKYFKFLEKQR